MTNFKDFNPATVPLSGSNLIEASAGTGKTYSIAILALRLVLEKQLSVKEILMVTFTNSAVAELEGRIRLFIRQAYKISLGEHIEDGTITAVVEEAVERAGAESVGSILKEAVLSLDETSVLTIHSFAQQSLNEFAFETGQFFGVELLQDMTGVLSDQVNAFWREKVTSIPPFLLNYLLSCGFSRSSLTKVLEEHLIKGKRYFHFDPTKTEYSLTEQNYTTYANDIQELIQQEETSWEELIQYVIQDTENLKEKCESKPRAKNAGLGALVDEPEKFLSHIWKKFDTGYIRELFPDLLEDLAAHHEIVSQRTSIIQNLITELNCWAMNEAAQGIASQKLIHNQLSYDDLILNLHNALVKKDNKALATCLHQKYKAVFIDEFQDTDRFQYEIFDKAFGNDTILFFIGDPKQSIYAWRKADIGTYFKARSTVNNLYSMNCNYRSSKALINAMNRFLKPDETFDTFHFGGASDAIHYMEVDSPTPNTKGNLMFEDIIETPICISECPNKPSIINAVASHVLSLLNPDLYSIQKAEGNRPIKPADIGILVRKNKEGQDVKKALAKYGIPSVIIGDDKVLKTDEARYLFYLLEAMLDISVASINKALSSPFTGFNDQYLLSLDEEQIIALFRDYKAQWELSGIFTALNSFIRDFNVKQVLLARQNESGERTLTNLSHLVELLHKSQSNKNLSPLELTAWLKRGIDGEEQEGDEYQQRIESDEEALKIVTIHNSKGLEYNIVLAPFLDLLTVDNFTTRSFQDSETGEYLSLETDRLSPEQQSDYIRQTEQENRRLIYVALTRAVYKCFVFKNTLKTGPFNCTNSALAPFVKACKGQENEFIRFNDGATSPGDYYSANNQISPAGEVQPVQFELMQPNWRKMSYTTLGASHQTTAKNTPDTHTDAYDQFIFSQLSKGAETGNMLHAIFENIAFADEGKWDYAINGAVRRYAPLKKDLYRPMINQMLKQVVKASIRTPENVFTLADINIENAIHEFEFDFPVSSFQADQIAKLSDEKMDLRLKAYQEMEGIMNGKIDLFFEHEGKYYVLDWKSNYLGGSTHDYSSDNVALAMNENNYHLQYLLYTLATKKYLESRLPNFDYENQFGGVIYLFLRGVRSGEETGVFFTKPELDKIKSLDRLLTNRTVPALAAELTI